MTPEKILVLSAKIFVLALGAIVLLQLLTGRINLQGLLAAKDGSTSISPERVQLLILTLAASFTYINLVSTSSGTTLPEVPTNLLYLFGGSSSLYAGAKLWRTLGGSIFGGNQ